MVALELIALSRKGDLDLNEATEHVVGDAHAGHVVVQEFGVARRGQRQDADDDLEAQGPAAGQKRHLGFGVKDRLGPACAMRMLLMLEAADLGLLLLRMHEGVQRTATAAAWVTVGMDAALFDVCAIAR